MHSVRTSHSRERLSQLLRATAGWITVEEAAGVLGVDRRAAAKQLARWAEQGWLKRIQRGHYAPIPLERTDAAAPLDDPWIVVPHLIPNGYVGGWTAAHHWDLTEQLFRDVCVFAPARSRRMERGGATYVVLAAPSKATLGLRAHWIASTRISISDPERTLVDMLGEPRAAPGAQQLADCLAEYSRSPRADFGKVVDYARRIGRGAVHKRLGFLLENAGLGTSEHLTACRRALTQGLAKLDPAVPCPRIVSRWRLRIPEAWAVVDR
jgi:predicted transcriptional regulator of viral defense system